MLVNNEGSVSGTFQYNQDLFDEPTIAGMVDHFLTLLEGISVQPESLLKDLPLLTVSEQQTLVHQGNETSMDSSGCDRIHELFESQVKQVPDNVAVEFDGNRLTYRELNEQANRVAHRLAKLGVESDTLVGVYLHRSIEMLVGLLGVLKSGAAFVPLSPETPSERLSGILDQCESPLVLTSDSLLKKLPSFGGQSVSLDPELLFGGESTDDPSRRVAPSDLAYVIFTSGSTGQPKGVQIEHRSVVNFLASMKLRPGIQSDDILLAVTTFTFDISVLELFLPLTVGGKVLIVDERTTSDGVQLSELIQRTSPTIMQATPSTWRLLVEAGWSGDPRLKLLCGGEALPPDLAESLIPRCGSLWNMYGPTETTIWSAVDDVKVSCNPMPIGRPIANTQLYILDDDLRPVPRGVKGSLFIGGNGLARGYLGKPELTSKHFVDDPFDPQKKGRLYRTGDLARHRTDGKIEFLGREDFQVKVRGFRIELNEIETQLIAHAEILQAIVLASNFSSRIDDKQLVAYFTFDKSAPNTSELRDYLRQKLPDYMVPSVFIPLDSFPLNSAGKINRLQLPRPGTIRPNLQSQFVAPRNATEKQMAAVWAKVLGLDSVGINDNFFDLGGASLQSLEIASLAGDSGIEMLPASLFQYPTIADLVAFGLGKPVEATSDDADRQLDLMTSPKVPTSVQPEVNDDEFGKRQVQKSNIVIESIGVYLPPKTLATRDVVAGCKKKVRFPLEDMTGIQSRHVSAENEFTSDIACAAVKECLNHSRFQPEQIDLVICCHIGRDEKENSAALEPGTAMYLKQKFDFPNAVAFDINNACAGMFTGIDIAESYIQSGAAHRVLVVSAEHISPVMTTAQQEVAGFIDPRIACLTLGDAGAAIILESSPADDVGFQELELYSLSKYSSMCIGKPTDQKHGGPILVVPNPIKHTSIAIKNSIAHSKLVMDRNSWDPDAIQWVIMHQTSERSLLDGARAINKSFKRNICTPENTINNLSQRGNTASTSHFVALWDNIRNGKIKSRDKIVFGITGSGQTIGTGLYTLDDLPDRIRNPKLTVKPTEKLERTTDASQLKSQRANQRVRISSVGVRSPDSDGALETLPMVREAVQACLKEANCDIREIDLVLFAGVYRTGFVSEPALATMIAGDLKINHAIQPGDARCTFAFDVVNGSLGFLTACDIATQSIRSGKIQKALVVASEVENNRAKFPNHLIGFKETASAVILESCPLGINGFGEFVVKYMPEKLEARTVTGHYTPSGPLVQLEQDSEIEDLFLSMIPDAVSELLARERISMKDIKLVMPPQFSRSFIDRLGVALDLPRAAMVDIAEKQDWYTSALPGTFREIESNQLSKPGDIGIVINVGAGLQVGCATYHF